MKSRSGLPRVVRLGFFGLAGLALAAIATPRLGAEIIEQVLVKVNGEILTKSDLETRQVGALRQKGEAIEAKGSLNNQQLRKALDEVTPRLLVDIVDEILIVQRGRELGYKLNDDQFKTVVDNIRKDNKIDSDEQFQAALTQEGMTMADLRRNLERQMIVSRVQQNEITGKISVSEDEAKTYYKAHVGEFTTPPTITLREVLIAIPASDKGVNVAQDEAAMSRAQLIRARSAAGTDDFAKLAGDVSDSPSKANGGLIGPISMSDLAPDLRKVIEPLKVGELSPIIRTPRGYQILRLESSTPVQTMSFEAAREQISARLGDGKRRTEFDKYLVKLRSQAIIEFKNPDIKKAYEEGLKQLAPTPAAH